MVFRFVSSYIDIPDEVRKLLCIIIAGETTRGPNETDRRRKRALDVA